MQRNYVVEIERRLLEAATVRRESVEYSVLIPGQKVEKVRVAAENLGAAAEKAKQTIASKKGWRGTVGDAIFHINLGLDNEGARKYNIFDDGTWYVPSQRRVPVSL